MIYVGLRKKIQEMVKSKSTLLWLEGTKYEQVNYVQMRGDKIILSLANRTIKIIQFEKYSITSVGIQFWNQGKPGVLYKWDLLDSFSKSTTDENQLLSARMPEDDPPPPDMAA